MRSFIVVPYHLGKRNTGAGKGPIRYAPLLASHGEEVEVIDVGCETCISEIDGVLRVNRAVAGAVQSSISRGCFPVVLGGDCMVSLGIVAGIGTNLSVFWFDAHGDFNTPETSPTGYLDGMPLAALAGRCYKNLLMGREPVPESNIFLVGARALDLDERTVLESSGINMISDVRDLERVRGRPEVYLHIDLDVLDPEEAPGVDFKAHGGLSMDEFSQMSSIIAKSADIRAVGITSYNPDLDVCGKTFNAGMEIISFLCGMRYC